MIATRNQRNTPDTSRRQRLRRMMGIVARALFVAVLVSMPVWAAEEASPAALLEKWKADPERAARLQQNLAAFRALPPERQEEVRQIQQALYAEDDATRHRLFAVAERYALWLGRLSEADRASVVAAPNSDERLKRVRALVEKQWIESQPAPYREKYERALELQRQSLVKQWKQDERTWYQDRLTDRRSSDDVSPPAVPINQLMLAREQIHVFAEESLQPLLTENETKHLQNAWSLRNGWMRYFKAVVDLTDKYQYPLKLPGTNPPPGLLRTPVRWADLPPAWR